MGQSEYGSTDSTIRKRRQPTRIPTMGFDLVLKAALPVTHIIPLGGNLFHATIQSLAPASPAYIDRRFIVIDKGSVTHEEILKSNPSCIATDGRQRTLIGCYNPCLYVFDHQLQKMYRYIDFRTHITHIHHMQDITFQLTLASGQNIIWTDNGKEDLGPDGTAHEPDSEFMIDHRQLSSMYSSDKDWQPSLIRLAPGQLCLGIPLPERPGIALTAVDTKLILAADAITGIPIQTQALASLILCLAVDEYSTAYAGCSDGSIISMNLYG